MSPAGSRRIDLLELVVGGDVTEALEGLDKVGVEAEKLGKSLRRTGYQLTRTFTLPLAAIGGASFKAAADFEQSMGRIEGLVGVQRSQLDAWRDDVRRLAAEFGRSGTEAADALFFITSAGLRGDAAMETLEASLKGAASGLGDVETIADLATSALNAYGEDALSATAATDVLTAAVREGKLPPEELAGSMGRVIPVAAAMGVRFDEVGAAMAAMSRTGTQADEAATQLRGILTGLLKPSKEAETAMTGMGLSAEGLRRQLREEGLLATLQSLQESTGGNAAEMGKLFPNVRGLTGVLDLMGTNAEATAEIFASLEGASGDLDRAFADQQTTWFKLSQMVGEAKRAFAEIGDAVLVLAAPAFEFGRDVLKGFADALADMTTTMKVAAVIFGGLLAAAGPVTIAIGALIPLVTKVGIALATTVAGPIALAIAAVGSLGLAAVQMIDHWDGVKMRFQLVWAAIKDAVFKGVDGVLTMLDRLFGNLPLVGEEIRGLREEFDRLSEDSMARSGAAIAELERKINEEFRAGLGETSSGVSDLRSELERLLAELETDRTSDDTLSPVQKAANDLEDALAQATAMNDLLGDSFDETEARASAYESAVQALVQAGVDFDAVVGPQGETLRQLADRYLDLKNGIDETARAQQEMEDAQNAAARITESVLTPTELYRQRLAELREHLEAGRISQETFNRAVKQAREEMEKSSTQIGEDLDRIESEGLRMASEFADAMAAARTDGMGAFKQFAEFAIDQILRVAAQFAVFKFLSFLFPGSAFVKAFGVQAGFETRQHGGPVSAHRPYIVGEAGPELFVPSGTGRVVASDAVGGGASAGAVAAGILERVGPLPGPMPPQALAVDDYWRQVFSEMVRDGRDRGVDI